MMQGFRGSKVCKLYLHNFFSCHLKNFFFKLEFLKMQECEDHLGGLIQCYDEETQGFLWLCEEHRHEYKPISSQASSPRSETNGTITPITEPSPQSSKPNSSGRLTPP